MNLRLRFATPLVLELAASLLAGAGELQPHVPVELGERIVTVTRLDALPYVDSAYSRRFRFDAATNPRLKELRERYRLEEVIASGQDEFDRQVRLMDWTHRQFKRFGQPSSSARGALEILGAIEQGHRFFCSQYGQLLASASASLGWVDRLLALRRHQGANRNGGSTEHTTTEIWSNQYAKWIMLDPTSNLYVEKEGVPLNAWEIRQEWFHREGKDLVFVVGAERRRYRKSDLPIVVDHFAEFGDLTFDPDEPDKYGFIGYIPNTDLMDSAFEYGTMFITKDALCDGTKWHLRDLPMNPATDPYFPMGQAAISLTPTTHATLTVGLRTLTPNFQRFEVRRDQGDWVASTNNWAWDLHPGTNRLECRTVNSFGILGPPAEAEVVVRATAPSRNP